MSDDLLCCSVMLCDGVGDCPNGEDEEHCDDIVCPGLLHCRDDNICVHPFDICDGVVHCLLSGDDENLCNIGECPDSCICRGTAMYCDRVAPEVKHISMDTSALVLHHVQLWNAFTLHNHRKLQYLSITNSTFYGNAIYTQTFAKLSDVQYLTLINNNITYIEKMAFSDMYRVKIVNVQGNRFNALASYMFDGFRSIVHMDLSKLFIRHLHRESFYGLVSCQHLDLTNNLISTLMQDSFLGMFNLRNLDLQHNPLAFIHKLFLSDYYIIVHVYMDYPYQCCYCRDIKHCKADCACSNPVLKSPCRNIVHSYITRVLNDISSAFILLFTFIYLVLIKSARKSHAYTILLQQLIIANSITATYMILMSVMSTIYQNSFIYLNTSWLNSYPCHFLRTIVTVSFTQARLVTFLIVINQLLATKYMFETHHYTDRHTYLMVVIASIVSLLVGSVHSLIADNSNINCFPFVVSADDSIYYQIYVMIVLCAVILMISVEIYLHYFIIQFVKKSHKKVRHTNTSQRGMSSMKQNAVVVVGIELIIWLLLALVVLYSYALRGDKYNTILISCYAQLSSLIHIACLLIRVFKSSRSP